ncbi:MAG TPA: ABC transporter ATP-binding protein [Firmicutes bacterium]|jgi:putative ABC transport system ATP-binding protein|nr:ABC transporter ATP-binding protein [Bacillota bacterium]
MIEAKELSLIYGNQKDEEYYALRDINFTAEGGEMVGIMGPSGSGKSSLLYILSGLKQPTTGTVYYHNTILNELSANELAGIRRKDFGFIFQRHFLIDYLTVLDNVLTVVNSNEKAWHEKAVSLLETLGIAHLALKKPYQMSVGQRQKVAIARALLNRPKVIFADEPTASLDHCNARIVMDVLAGLKSQTTILVATHDESILEQADRMIQMWDGRIIKTTRPSDLLHFYQEPK